MINLNNILLYLTKKDTFLYDDIFFFNEIKQHNDCQNSLNLLCNIDKHYRLLRSNNIYHLYH